MMKILVSADMEGISGVTNWDQVLPGNADYPRFCRIMTAEVNAAVEGAFEGGATEVLVVDGHNAGYNILIEELDGRACLHSGTSAPFSVVQGIQAGDFSGVIFIGHHARSGTGEAVLAHTWSGSVINVWLNDILVGECGLLAAVCGAFGAPVLMITGDQNAIIQAKDLLSTLETVIVKQSTSYSSAECLHPVKAQKMIRESARRAVTGIKEKKTQPFTVNGPVKVIIQFKTPEIADFAAWNPDVKRLDGNRIELSQPDMPAAYLSFQAAMLAI